MNSQTCEQIRPRCRQLQNGRPAERVSDDVRGRDLLSRNQQSEVRDILLLPWLAGRSLWLCPRRSYVSVRNVRASPGTTGSQLW